MDETDEPSKDDTPVLQKAAACCKMYTHFKLSTILLLVRPSNESVENMFDYLKTIGSPEIGFG